MSTLDFWAGRQAANIANRSSIAEWNAYADELERQLKGAKDALIYSSPRRRPGSSSLFFLDSRVRGNDIFSFNQRLPNFDFVKAESGRIGFAHLLKIVSEELRRMDPNNPLIQKDVQLTILRAKVAEKASELGYNYDEKNGTIEGEGKNAV